LLLNDVSVKITSFAARFFLRCGTRDVDFYTLQSGKFVYTKGGYILTV